MKTKKNSKNPKNKHIKYLEVVIFLIEYSSLIFLFSLLLRNH